MISDGINADREQQGQPTLRGNQYTGELPDLDSVHAAWEKVSAAIQGACAGFARASEDLAEALDLPNNDAELARRKDTLHREAAAALGRGDRKTHKKALAELRRIDRWRS